MSDTTTFDYYYGDESSQFSFYRIPRQLITGEQFKRLSTDAKLLYGLLLDRMGLSAKNGWYDDLGRVYIYCTLYEIQEDLNCGHDKAVKLLSELDTGKGFGLIERVKQGQGKPAKVYVKRFTTKTVPPSSPEPEQEPPPRLPIIGSADFGKSAGNYIKSIQTNAIQLDPSIHPSPSPPCGAMMDRYDCRREVEESVDYEILCGRYARVDMDEVVELITDVLCSNRSTYHIGGEDLPIAQVKGRFYKLDSGHLEYVFDCLRKNTTQIRNIRAYLLTALYNAPATINNYYQAEVQHDFGWQHRLKMRLKLRRISTYFEKQEEKHNGSSLTSASRRAAAPRPRPSIRWRGPGAGPWTSCWPMSGPDLPASRNRGSRSGPRTRQRGRSPPAPHQPHRRPAVRQAMRPLPVAASGRGLLQKRRRPR